MENQNDFNKKIEAAISNLKENDVFLTDEEFDLLQSEVDTKDKAKLILTYLIEETYTIEKLQKITKDLINESN